MCIKSFSRNSQTNLIPSPHPLFSAVPLETKGWGVPTVVRTAHSSGAAPRSFGLDIVGILTSRRILVTSGRESRHSSRSSRGGPGRVKSNRTKSVQTESSRTGPSRTRSSQRSRRVRSKSCLPTIVLADMAVSCVLPVYVLTGPSDDGNWQ